MVPFCVFLFLNHQFLFKSLKKKKYQLPRVTVVPSKGSSADVFQTSKSHELQTAPSGAGPPPLPRPVPSAFVAITNFRKKK